MAHFLYKALLTCSILLVSTGGIYDEAYHILPTPPFTQHTIYTPSKTTAKELQCLTRAIYYEAGNQSRAGKEAVGIVIINRVVTSRYPNSICGVVYQSYLVNEKRICQFSFHCEPPRKINTKLWNESHTIAKRILTNTFDRAILSQIENATYFHAKYVRPQWSKEKVLVATIDHHLFYKEKEYSHVQGPKR